MDTSIELIVRHELFSRGHRYRINVKELPGKPDIVLKKYRTAIFVNGCFWHGHEKCSAGRLPKTRTSYWQEKIGRNIERDTHNLRSLTEMGWHTVVVWECQIKKDMNVVIGFIESSLNTIDCDDPP